MVGRPFEKARVIIRNLRMVVLAPYISSVSAFLCIPMQRIVDHSVCVDLANMCGS